MGNIIVAKIQLNKVFICEQNLNDIHRSICFDVIPFEIQVS